MQFYSTEFGSYPFAEFKAVFVRDARSLASTSATMSILSADLLYPPDIIDQALITRQTLSLTLAQQWIGINVIQRTLSDTWLIHGLALYLNSLFLRNVLGNNEYRFRLKKDIERCVHLDQGDKWPICMPGSLDTPDIPFINLKAPLVLHILDRHLTKAGTSLGLSRVIPRIFLAALSDELTGNTLSTQFFFKTCRKVSGLDLQPFQDQWVLGSGCPIFRLYTNFIRKKFTVELYLTQVIRAANKRATTLFEGGLTVRIHEADGAPFEHVVDIKSMQKTYNLPFNTKYKRTRRSGHIAARFRKLQQDLAAEDDQEETQPKTAEAFAYTPWDEEEERKRWRVAEWSDEQVEVMMGEGGGYEWIRIDPDCEWLASFEFSEKPWYWISQLQSDRDVAAQLEARFVPANADAQAIQNMALNPSPVVASELVKTLMVKNYFYRVRMEAARALVNVSRISS
jgi:transcription initiation factor TFIID subunit 2